MTYARQQMITTTRVFRSIKINNSTKQTQTKIKIAQDKQNE